MCFRIGTITEDNKDSFGRMTTKKAKHPARGQGNLARRVRKQQSYAGKKELEPAAAQ